MTGENVSEATQSLLVSCIDSRILLLYFRSVIMLTQSGYIKRMPLTEFEQQSRGTRGKAGAKMQSNDDLVAQFIACNAHDHIIFISDKGLAYGVRAFQIPLGSRTAKGTPLPQVCALWV